ncbi:hypothetical protein EV586_103598 [Tumebacillus sp. BK434]|nr:hypothetical protein EV586_103598 [Tumebacillus sp. BK434]
MNHDLEQLEIVEAEDLQVGHAFHTFMFQSHLDESDEE